MAGLKIEGLGGKNSIKVEVPVASRFYQNYLDTLKEDARLTELYGGRTSKGIEGVRIAVEELNSFALTTFIKQKSN